MSEIELQPPPVNEPKEKSDLELEREHKEHESPDLQPPKDHDPIEDLTPPPLDMVLEPNISEKDILDHIKEDQPKEDEIIENKLPDPY